MRNWELPQMSRIIPFIFYSCEEIKNVLWIPVTVLLSYHPLFCQRLLACRVISDHFFIVLSLRLQKRFSFLFFLDNRQRHFKKSQCRLQKSDD